MFHIKRHHITNLKSNTMIFSVKGAMHFGYYLQRSPTSLGLHNLLSLFEWEMFSKIRAKKSSQIIRAVCVFLMGQEFLRIIHVKTYQYLPVAWPYHSDVALQCPWCNYLPLGFQDLPHLGSCITAAGARCEGRCLPYWPTNPECLWIHLH